MACNLTKVQQDPDYSAGPNEHVVLCTQFEDFYLKRMPFLLLGKDKVGKTVEGAQTGEFLLYRGKVAATNTVSMV